MQEEFLWHIWKFRLFNSIDLVTIQGEPLKILKTGEHNIHAGPDFINARIIIGDTEWAGNVEIHSQSSDWHKHNHSNNKEYDNIILHVVYNNDKPIFRKNGEKIPALEIKARIAVGIYSNYQKLKSCNDWIPCEKQISLIDKFTLNSWIDRLLIERLERKSNTLIGILKEHKNDWEETFYQMLARNFGQTINADPFEMLAKYLPYSYLAKHKNSLLQIEAMLFGVSGMLQDSKDNNDNGINDAYFLLLKNEFSFLSKKFKLQPMNASTWKFMRLHPINFPTIRIAQFANLLFERSHLFSKILEATTIQEVYSLLQAESSFYWNTHYRFNVLSINKKKVAGGDFVSTLIINTIVPCLFAYGKINDKEEYCLRAISFLEAIKPERNSIIAKWNSLGIAAKSAYDSQALLQLKSEYCSKKRCLDCNIGCALLAS